MRLSIIVPAYNCRAYIDECLTSITDQMWDDSELIVVDDGSDDGTDRILEKYRDVPCVKVMFRSHEGASGARNAGIDAASGDYITFVDCDDRLKPGFLRCAEDLLPSSSDMIIFGIERHFLDGRSEISALEDHFYPDISYFADEYIRKRAMLIYSVGNKFYDKKLIDMYHIRFLAGLEFGEDRLFNYSFLLKAQTVFTSEIIMYDYMQRSLCSMSSKHFPGFFSLLCDLHEEKMKCFLTLSGGTDRGEREDFVNYDMKRTVIAAIERFCEHPEEIDENLPSIGRIIFGDDYNEEDRRRLMNADIPDQSEWFLKPCDNAAISGLL
ncbi:MAG: glycosyltransferase family 2 protein [Lachnospiraceae bacterium]|nr:glycosyltransferase family 2 protein [Lachnospiraceae bacterium]